MPFMRASERDNQLLKPVYTTLRIHRCSTLQYNPPHLLVILNSYTADTHRASPPFAGDQLGTRAQGTIRSASVDAVWSMVETQPAALHTAERHELRAKALFSVCICAHAGHGRAACQHHGGHDCQLHVPR